MKANEAPEQYIPKSALVAEIERRKKAIIDDNGNLGFKDCQKAFNEIDELKKFINTLEVKEVDLELITGWFDHIAQIANDRKTLNGVIMEDWAALDEIKCLARNSSEFIQKYL